MTAIVSTHERILRQKHRKKSTDEYAWHRKAVGGAIIASILMSFVTIIAVTLAWKYAGSIAIIHDTKLENMYGQVIGSTGAIHRVPADVQARAVLRQWGRDAFSVFSSHKAMSLNYTEALSFYDPKAVTEQAKLRAWWVKHNSPLHADGEFDVHHVIEADVDMKSVLQRATVENGGIEYEVNYLVTYAQEGMPPQYILADVTLTPGGTITDANPGGLDITYNSITEQK